MDIWAFCTKINNLFSLPVFHFPLVSGLQIDYDSLRLKNSFP
ncbi:hypothetical protein BACCAP_01433 [Pseudoflavonifractor capillosus ATCC 29799]|uniref:Uncharacterized protein n=1 Tax=Pseudoflavonifractor capillosus ATCC 29799 TaxID=411467 RepID=A6NTA4_9FIRM|nr:hypothetical protein BACCAP_01433 [Pseudoflavonifractor capillosus ATCC 29799]